MAEATTALKPSVYYRDAEQANELVAGVKGFAFDELREKPNFVIVAGREGVGKTHLVTHFATTKKPMFIMDTEARVEDVVRKLPPELQAVIKFKKVRSYIDMVVFAKYLIKNVKAPATIVIDSGSDLQVFAEQEFLERSKLDKVYPQVLWAEIYAMCDKLIDDLKTAGFDIVLTARLKEMYLKDKGTGDLIPKLYDRLPYKADIVIQFDENANMFLRKPHVIEVLNTTIPRELPLVEIIRHVREEMAFPAATTKLSTRATKKTN